MHSGASDFSVESDTVLIEGSGGPQNLFVTFFEDGVAQEPNETFTINLEPTFSSLESVPSGEAVFFVRSVKMTIVDSDRKNLKLMFTLNYSTESMMYGRCKDGIL